MYLHISRRASIGTCLFVIGPTLARLRAHSDPALAYLAETLDTTPISGWYGPGAWIAYVLVSLGALSNLIHALFVPPCTHAPATSASGSQKHSPLPCKACPTDRWDPELVACLAISTSYAVDLARRSIDVIYDPISVQRKDMPAMQAAATATYVAFGIAQVAVCAITFRMLRKTNCERLEIIRAHRRRLAMVVVLVLVTYTAVALCERSQGLAVTEYSMDQKIDLRIKAAKDHTRQIIESAMIREDTSGRHPQKMAELRDGFAEAYRQRIDDINAADIVHILPTLEWAQWRSAAALGVGASLFTIPRFSREHFLQLVQPPMYLLSIEGQTYTFGTIITSYPMLVRVIDGSSSWTAIWTQDWLQRTYHITIMWLFLSIPLLNMLLLLLTPTAMAALFMWFVPWLLFTPGSGFFPVSHIPVTAPEQAGVLAAALVILGLHWGPGMLAFGFEQLDDLRGGGSTRDPGHPSAQDKVPELPGPTVDTDSSAMTDSEDDDDGLSTMIRVCLAILSVTTR